MGKNGVGKSEPVPSDNRRVFRVEREIREVIGSYLLGGFRGQLSGLVSVSRVIVTKDLRSAKVFISVLGEDDERKQSLAELQAFAHEVQFEVNRRLRMKFCPKLRFMADDSLDQQLRVEQILHNIALERKKRESGVNQNVISMSERSAET